MHKDAEALWTTQRKALLRQDGVFVLTPKPEVGRCSKASKLLVRLYDVGITQVLKSSRMQDCFRCSWETNWAQILYKVISQSSIAPGDGRNM